LAMSTAGILMLIAVDAGAEGAYGMSAGFFAMASWLGWRAFRACAMAAGVASQTLYQLADREKSIVSDRMPAFPPPNPVHTNGFAGFAEPILQPHYARK
jgi:hypothetical protein